MLPAGALVLAGIFLARSKIDNESLEVSQLTRNGGAGASAEDLPALPESPAPESSPDSVSQAVDYSGVFAKSEDFWALAESIVQAANAGDGNAQYNLYRALSYCDTLYKFYFVRGKTHKTVDEAVAWASTSPGLNVDEARQVHRRCHRLKTADGAPFGTAEQWLTSAKDVGQPLAMMDFARNLSTAAAAKGDVPSVEMRNEARQLITEALKSKDPEVIFGMADFVLLLHGDSEKASEEQWVWRLAACERGFDCAPGAAWLEVMCRYDYNCQPRDDGREVIRRNNSQNFDEIERKARELNARLDANKFEEALAN